MPRERWHTSQARALDLVEVDERTFERCKAYQCREPYGSDTVGGNRYRAIQTIKHTHVQQSFLER